MDKAIYLIDKEFHTKDELVNVTQKDLEKWVAEESYNEDFTIVKIDGNGYDSVSQAIENEMPYLSIGDVHEDYWVFAFGLK